MQQNEDETLRRRLNKCHHQQQAQPHAAAAAAAASLLPTGWIAYRYDRYGTLYYHHEVTGVVQWEIPDGPQPQCPAAAGSSNDHHTSTGLPPTHPAAIAHADSIQQAKDLQEAIANR